MPESQPAIRPVAPVVCSASLTGDQRAKHDQDRPIHVIVGFARRQGAAQHHQGGRAKEGDRHRYEAGRGQRHGEGEDAERDEAAPYAAKPQRTLGQRQAAEIGELARQMFKRALQHDDIAGAQPEIAQLLPDPLAGARDREEIDAVGVMQADLARGAAGENGIRRHHGFDDAHILGRILRHQSAVLALQRQCASGDGALERFRVPLQDQRVVLGEHSGARNAAAGAEDPHHLDLAVTHGLEGGGILADRLRPRGDDGFSGVSLDVQRLAHGRRRAPLAGDEPVGEHEEDEPDRHQP